MREKPHWRRPGSMRESSLSQHYWPGRLCLWGRCVSFLSAKKKRAADASTAVQVNSYAKIILIQFTQEVDHFTNRKSGSCVEGLESKIFSSHLFYYDVEPDFMCTLAVRPLHNYLIWWSFFSTSMCIMSIKPAPK